MSLQFIFHSGCDNLFHFFHLALRIFTTLLLSLLENIILSTSCVQVLTCPYEINVLKLLKSYYADLDGSVVVLSSS